MRMISFYSSAGKTPGLCPWVIERGLFNQLDDSTVFVLAFQIGLCRFVKNAVNTNGSVSEGVVFEYVAFDNVVGIEQTDVSVLEHVVLDYVLFLSLLKDKHLLENIVRKTKGAALF